jgi:Abnormal spindle-like microcephaly-assoc'd, ASPM-SPD-2-Hydin
VRLIHSGLRSPLTGSWLAFSVSLFLLSAANTGCVTSKMNANSGGTTAAGSLSVGPTTMSFGNVTVGSSQDQTGRLSASAAKVTVQTASWSGTGFSVSGISFPVTIPAGQSVPFAVTFAPQVTGATTGSITFLSDAANTPGGVVLSGTGVQTVQHSVTLNWNASTSAVQGYYVYRGTTSGGPYTRLSSLGAGLSYVDTSVTSGTTYYYAVTAVDSANLESSYSNQASASIP